jgi:acetate kinase
VGLVPHGFASGPHGDRKDRTDRTSDGIVTVTDVATGHNERRIEQVPDHAASVRLLIDQLAQSGKGLSVQAIGHRVVHGGSRYAAPQVVSAEVMDELRRLSPYDPEHLPAEITFIEAFGTEYPQVPQVACFDTGFHQHLPPVARLLAIPRRYETLGIRRYGFHGLSYAFLMEELERVAGRDAARGKVILAHLGNGASLAAVRDGVSIDTSMGFTPASGLPMSTRSGDLDPGLVSYLARTEGMTTEQFHHMVNAQSGLLGLSEISPDLRDLLAQEGRDARAAEAVALFCYQGKKWIGAYAAALGGLEQLVFSGGIGEHAAVVRARMCEGPGVSRHPSGSGAERGQCRRDFQPGESRDRAGDPHRRRKSDCSIGLPVAGIERSPLTMQDGRPPRLWARCHGQSKPEKGNP